MTESTNKIHEANKKRWDAASERWPKGANNRGLWKRCPTEPRLVLCDKELEYLGDISGKHVCVLGSGDNQVVFALAGLRAAVTSVDISQNQLDVARQRAESLGLSVTFVQADVTDLSMFENGSFDTVYTGGHVAVWVADLQRFYDEAARILKPGGLLIINEYHPFRRIWKDSTDTLTVESHYFERGPFVYELSEDILKKGPALLRSYEFHWTVADYINTALNAGCFLVFIDEHGKEVADWEGAPLHGLPEFLLIVAQKSAG
jgi:ubiquinone/menaquinone biosynthesis C-methylase UbiE